ncbi:MAG: iron ABC transporter permease [Synergistaceae bacterium]|nr:iron ABC transporter permease [Synergistota bacterium]NLM72367.1 iron ABC transporter permease [Synergistaceae bacterium]
MRRLVMPSIIVLSLVCLATAPFIGMQSLSLADIADEGSGGRILRELRIPRALLGWTTGATLSLCGMVFQALFRNSLASPDMLGVSTGAAFGAVVSIRYGLSFTLFGLLSSLSVCSFLGAMAAVATICAAWRLRGGGISEGTLLLSGVAVSFLFSSLNMILQYGGGYVDTFRVMRWSMGGIQTVGFSSLGAAVPAMLLILFMASAFSRELDLMVCGEEIAMSRGVQVERVRWLLFLAVSLSVGMNVAVCGPIGFVGLVAPHICRSLVGAEHSRLCVASLFFGGGFLVLCDTAARTLWAPAEIPVGVLTSCIGSAFFLWLLIGRGRRNDRWR